MGFVDLSLMICSILDPGGPHDFTGLAFWLGPSFLGVITNALIIILSKTKSWRSVGIIFLSFYTVLLIYYLAMRISHI